MQILQFLPYLHSDPLFLLSHMYFYLEMQLISLNLLSMHKITSHLILPLFFVGLGEVNEGLVNDENLTPADFLDDLNVSPDICAAPQTKTSNACFTDFKTENGDQFKTPVTSRYSHKITETPCLFSQDESTTCICSPTSSKYS